MTDLKTYLENKLSVQQYNDLPETLGISKTRLTQMLKDQLSIDGRELIALCDLIAMPVENFVEDFLTPQYKSERPGVQVSPV